MTSITIKQHEGYFNLRCKIRLERSAHYYSRNRNPTAKVSTTSNPAYGQRVATAVGKWEEEERVRIAGFGVEKLEGSRKESVSQRRSRSSDVPSSGERMRSKSRDDRKDSRNLDLRKEHDEMRARNQVGM